MWIYVNAEVRSGSSRRDLDDSQTIVPFSCSSAATGGLVQLPEPQTGDKAAVCTAAQRYSSAKSSAGTANTATILPGGNLHSVGFFFSDCALVFFLKSKAANLRSAPLLAAPKVCRPLLVKEGLGIFWTGASGAPWCQEFGLLCFFTYKPRTKAHHQLQKHLCTAAMCYSWPDCNVWPRKCNSYQMRLKEKHSSEETGPGEGNSPRTYSEIEISPH